MFFSSSSFRHPIEYHRNNTNKKSRDHIIHGYVGTVAIAALIFCIPKFFESKVIGITEKKMTLDTISNISEMVSDDIAFYFLNLTPNCELFTVLNLFSFADKSHPI